MDQIQSLIDRHLYERAEAEALSLAKTTDSYEIRVTASLLAAECAAKQGNHAQAEDLLNQILMSSSLNDSYCQQAILNLAKVYLRKSDVALAEKVFLALLAHYPAENKLSFLARFCLGQVYEAQCRWDLAADVYHQAAKGFADLNLYRQALAAYQNELWTLLGPNEIKEPGRVQSVFHACEQTLEYWADDSCRHIQSALLCYYLYRAGAHDAAAVLANQLLNLTADSHWAACVIALTAGNLTFEAGMIQDAERACRLAEEHLTAALRETGSTDLADLVNTLRNRIILFKGGLECV